MFEMVVQWSTACDHSNSGHAARSGVKNDSGEKRVASRKHLIIVMWLCLHQLYMFDFDELSEK